MQLILIKSVPKLGNPGDIVDVSAGYGRNFLLAQGLAREATMDAVRQTQARRARAEKERLQADKKKTDLRAKLEGGTILLRASASSEGKLFVGVGSEAISQAIAKRKKITVDPANIVIPHNHLKTLGTHQVVLQLGGGEKINLTVEVVPEGEA